VSPGRGPLADRACGAGGADVTKFAFRSRTAPTRGNIRPGGIGLERMNAVSMSFGPVLTVPA